MNFKIRLMFKTFGAAKAKRKENKKGIALWSHLAKSRGNTKINQKVGEALYVYIIPRLCNLQL